MNMSCSLFQVLGKWVPDGITRAMRGISGVPKRGAVVWKVVVLQVLWLLIDVRFTERDRNSHRMYYKQRRLREEQDAQANL